MPRTRTTTWDSTSKTLVERSIGPHKLTKDIFRRRFRAGLIAAWLIPPATGELGMTFLGFWELREAGLSLIRFTGIYIIGFTLIAFFVFKRQVIEPVMALGDDQQSLNPVHTRSLKAFPWVFWELLSLYCCFGPPSVLLSNAVFQGTRYTFGQYAFSAFGVIPFLLIAAFPLFFYLTDLLGRFLAPRGIMVMVAPLWLKVTVLGLFTPVMIDTILLTYYFNRTGFLAAETIMLWFLLLLTAGVGTRLALRSFHQGMFALKQPLGGVYEVGSQAYPVPRSLDEFGLLARGWADLLAARDDAERQIRESDRRTWDIIDNTEAVIYIKDKEGRYLLINRCFEQLFEVSGDDIVGRTDYDIFPQEIADVFHQNDLKIIRDKKPFQIQENFPNKDSSSTYISQKFPLYDAEGVLYGVCSVSTDITERKLAEEALRESEERFRTLVEQASDGIFVSDALGNYVDVNSSGCQMVGYTKSEILKLNITDLVLAEDSAADPIQFDELRRGKTIIRERRLKCKDGSILPVEISAKMLSDGRLQGIVRDITERKQAEAHIQHLQSVLNAIRNVNQLIVHEKNRKKLLQGACEILNQNRNYKLVWIGLVQEGTKAVLPVAQAGFDKSYLQSIKITWGNSETGKGPTGTAIRTRKPFVMRDIAGDPRYTPWRKEAMKRGYVSSLAAPLVYENRVFGALNVYTSLTDAFDEEEIGLLVEVGQDIAFALHTIGVEEEREQAKQKLAQRETLLRTIIETEPECVKLLSEDSTLLEMNSAGLAMIEADSLESVIGKPVARLVTPEYRKSFKALVESVFRGESETLQFEIVGIKGTCRWLETHAVPLRNEKNEIIALLGITRDITAGKEAERKLQHYQQQLRSLASELSLAEERERRRIAEDLHDHIAQTLAMAKIKLAELQEMAATSTEFAQPLDIIQTMLEQTVNDARSLIFEISSPILHELGFEAAVEWLTEHFSEQHDLLFNFEDDKKDKPLDDHIRIFLFKALQELLINIVKHAKAATARICIRRKGENIEVLVEDDGRGFNVSTADYQAGKTGGFGLFNICERLDYHGGTCEIKSEPGRGTQVILEAPLKRKPLSG